MQEVFVEWMNTWIQQKRIGAHPLKNLDNIVGPATKAETIEERVDGLEHKIFKNPISKGIL